MDHNTTNNNTACFICRRPTEEVETQDQSNVISKNRSFIKEEIHHSSSATKLIMSYKK